MPHAGPVIATCRMRRPTRDPGTPMPRHADAGAVGSRTCDFPTGVPPLQDPRTTPLARSAARAKSIRPVRAAEQKKKSKKKGKD